MHVRKTDTYDPIPQREKTDSMIDWQDITNGYNERYGTEFDVPGMFADCYRRVGESVILTAEELGVSHGATQEKMLVYNIRRKIQYGGRKNTTREQLLKIPAEKLKNMTRSEIANCLGKSYSGVSREIRKLGLEAKTANWMKRMFCPHCGRKLCGKTNE